MRRDRNTLREIQRQGLVEDQGFVRSFPATQRTSPGDHCRQLYASVVLVTAALIVLMLVGPNVLTEKEIVARRMPPAPRRSSATPWSLDELTRAIGVSRTSETFGVAESATSFDLWPAAPGTKPGNDVIASSSLRWHTSSAAA